MKRREFVIALTGLFAAHRMAEAAVNPTDPIKIEKAIGDVFDLRPGAIIRDLRLLRPIYAQTAAYGHFGRTDIDLPWERLDKVDDLKRTI